MAITEACKFEIKEHVDQYVKNGLSRNQAAKEIAKWFKDWIPGQAKSEIDTLDTLHLNAPQLHPTPAKKEKGLSKIG